MFSLEIEESGISADLTSSPIPIHLSSDGGHIFICPIFTPFTSGEVYKLTNMLFSKMAGDYTSPHDFSLVDHSSQIFIAAIHCRLEFPPKVVVVLEDFRSESRQNA